MTLSRKAIQSFAPLRLGRGTIYFFPFRAIVYGIFSLAIVAAILLFIDRVVLSRLERGGWTAGELWARHNKRIEENHRRKTTATACELREWNGQPVRSAPHKILVLGDSFVWGPPYTTLNHLWWWQLAIELERRGYHDVTVVAAGNPGWSTRMQLDCAMRLIPEINPDIVIWGYVTNDPDEKCVRQISDLQERLPYGERIRRQLRWMLPNLSFKFESLRADKLAAQYTGPEYGYAYPDWELKLLEGENFERYRQTIHDVGEFMREAKIPAFMQTLPHFPGREYFEPRYAPVLKEWQAAGITVNDTLNEFVTRFGNFSATNPDSLRFGINPGDSHPGPQLTHFHAVMAADLLEKTWPDVLGAKDTLQPHELAINDWLPFGLNVRPTNDQTFELDYPPTTDFMFQPPREEPTALVALRYPLPLQAIRLEGIELLEARVWISTLHPSDPYDENEWHELKTDQSGGFVLPDPLAHRSVAEIRFRADFLGANRRLRLTLIRAADATERP